MNTIFMLGNTGKDPEIKTFEDGGKEARFSIAQSKGPDQPTQWFDCRARGKLVENVIEPYVKKGTKISVVGELRVDYWEKDGQKRSSTYIYVKEMELASSKNSTEGSENTNKENTDLPASDFNDLPF